MSVPKSMRAARHMRYGGPEVIEIVSVPVPQCGDQEVLVRIHYSTVNRTDYGFLLAKPAIVRLFSGITKPRFTILGCEFSGEVVECGQDVQDYRIGDRVVGFKDDDFGFGGHAEYTTMNVNGMLAKIPEHISYKQAAPSLEGAHYALQLLRDVTVKEGTTVLINGATGAIGSAALQLCVSVGAEVTAVCGTNSVETIERLGPVNVVDYHNEDFTQLDKKFDLVFDAVGKSTFGECLDILNDTGAYASSELGPYCQNPWLAIFTSLFGKKRVLFSIPKNLKSDVDYLISMMEHAEYIPLIDKSFLLKDIAEAFAYVGTGEKIGNVVIDIGANA